jgi:hypothetical protein
MSTRPNSNKPNKFGIFVAVIIGTVLVIHLVNRNAGSPSRTVVDHVLPSRNPIEQMLEVSSNSTKQEGIAAAILIDVSGSMNETVRDAAGQPKPKIDIARHSALNILALAQKFVSQNPDKSLKIGIYEFSSLDHQPPCRRVVSLGPPDVNKSQPLIESMHPNGGTPIGDAIVIAKRDLDLSSLTHLHILVITDGENNQGYSPSDVVDAIFRLPEENRASIYFIAFDISAENFKSVRNAGGLVLSAANEQELQQTVDYVLTGRILAEQPETSKTR